jgi:hypothetical protein
MLNQLLSALPWRRERSQDALARQIAELSIDDVCAAVSQSLWGMSLCEARGYIRARSLPAVRQHSALVLGRLSDVPAAWEPAIVVKAADRVAPLALRRLTARRTRHVLQPVALRRAA